MKLKVKATFFDRLEDRYIYPEKEAVIEREPKRAKALIAAGVVEEAKEDPTPAEEPKPKKKAKKTE